MKKWLTPLMLALTLLQGCSSIVGATRSEPITTDPSNRTLGTRIDDQNLEIIANVNIDKVGPDFKKARIEVDSFNGVLLLTGQVATQDMREQVADVVRRIDNVRQVHNELQVQSNIPVSTRTHDAWLVTKLKTKLLASKEIAGSKIKVIAENGTIFLMGLVNRDDAQTITDIASNTRGVKSVVRVFEYIDLSTDSIPSEDTNAVDIQPGLQIIE